MEKINGKSCEEVQSAEEKLELTKQRVETDLSRKTYTSNSFIWRRSTL